MSPPRHPPELGDEPVEVPPAVEHDVPGDGVDEPADRGRVGQRPGRQHPARQAGEERLLAGDAVQVAALEAVALPDEGERVGAADGLRARGEVDPGPDLVLGPLRHTGTPPIASVISTNPARLISA